MLLRLEQILVNGGTQPRAELLIEVMEDYAEQMKCGVKFPPITVFFDGKGYWLADGFHRLGAHLRAFNDDTPIEAEVIQGSQTDAQWYSFGVNKTNGVHRNREDVKRAVKAALLHPQGAKRSDRDIAEHVGASHHTVAKYRSELKLVSGGQIAHLDRRTGRDGKEYRASQPRPASPNGSKGKSKKQKKQAKTRHKVHAPTRAPSPVESMTAVSLPHNPVMGARTLIEVFDADYLRALVTEISDYLKGLEP